MQSGFALGIVLLAVMAIITDYTVILLIKNGKLAKKYTYQVRYYNYTFTIIIIHCTGHGDKSFWSSWLHTPHLSAISVPILW